MSKFATGVTTEPPEKKARVDGAPIRCPENVQIISADEDLGEDNEPTNPGQKMYKVDLRGASNFTLKFN